MELVINPTPLRKHFFHALDSIIPGLPASTPPTCYFDLRMAILSLVHWLPPQTIGGGVSLRDRSSPVRTITHTCRNLVMPYASRGCAGRSAHSHAPLETNCSIVSLAKPNEPCLENARLPMLPRLAGSTSNQLEVDAEGERGNALW